MDRNTIKTLLMTTSVVAIIAGTGQEAVAAVCDIDISGATTTFPAMTTNVNCISITNSAITNDVTITPPNTVGGVLSGAQVFINNSILDLSLTNNSTIIGNVGSFDIGIQVAGTSLVGNGITNGSTGVIRIDAENTLGASPRSATGIGIYVNSSKFTGNVANNGTIDVVVLADPAPTASAHGTGIGVLSTSFVGNVINTFSLSVLSTAIAGSSSSASATSRARGISVSSPSFSTGTLAGSGATAFSAFVQGNISNSGVLSATAFSTAIATGAGAGTGAATSVAEGIFVVGNRFTGNLLNTSGVLSATLADTFIGNITNTSEIFANATAFSTKLASGGLNQANAVADAYGIRLVGDQFTGNLTSGGLALTGISSTVSAAFTANITNSDLIDAEALVRASADATSGTATANVISHVAGIDVVGVIATGNVSLTSLGNITNVYSGAFTGNISNRGVIFANGSVFGISENGGAGGTTSMVSLTQSGAGISVTGVDFSGNVANTGGGTINNTLNFAFLGNVSNSGTIDAFGTSVGSAYAEAGQLASATVESNNAGISVIGGVFTGNVVATGFVDSLLNDTFTGNITNALSGLISVASTASGTASLSVTGGTGTAITTVKAAASGIRLIGGSFAGTSTGGNAFTGSNVFFNGNVINNGRIFASATAFGQASLGSTTGLVQMDVQAEAHGIAVLGAVFSGNAQRVGSLAGNIANTGFISAHATAFGTFPSAPTVSSSDADLKASAQGILAVLSRITGNVSNTGTIDTFARALFDSDSTQISSTTTAIADGIHVSADFMTGNIGNGGLIHSLATSFNGGQTGLALATANGIYANFISFTGNISNTGQLWSVAIASDTTTGGSAGALAAGISLINDWDYSGTVSSGPGSSIFASAVSTAFSVANAAATGIAVDASRMFGDVVNNGNIVVSAFAGALDSATNTGVALAAGIHVGDPGGPFQYVFEGNVTNTGLIDVMSTASGANFAQANAFGVQISNSTLSGQLRGVSFVSGNVTNSGTISAQGFALSDHTAYALAAGVLVAASTFVGNASNSGKISALAQGQVFSSLTAFPTAAALATGLDFTGGTGSFSAFMSTFVGNVTNASTGVISAQAQASAIGDETARLLARAVGIDINGNSQFLDFGPTRFVVAGVSSLSGNVTNDGIITAGAAAIGGTSALAEAVGINVLFSSFLGNVANGGTITAVASVQPSLGFGDSTALAVARGINLAGDTSSGFAFFATTFSGNVSNTGQVIASASANVLNIGEANAGAVASGISLFSSTVTGNVTNSSTGFIQASAVANPTAQFVAFGSAFAAGIDVHADTFVGGVSNAGTILANATAISLTNGINPPGSTAFAEAIGINIDAQTFLGNITNTGFIGASARAAAQSAVGTAFASDAAFGIALFSTIAIGTVANSGTLVSVSTFVGNIKNAGTIMAFSSASATAGGTFANALDPATGILIDASTFTGAVVNNGLIVTGATATAQALNETQAYALSAGIGINDPFFRGGFTFAISTFTGDVSNAGTILASATASILPGFGDGTVSAGATGIRAFADTFLGGISNTGFIQANASANSELTFRAFGSHVPAFAAGIHVGGVTSDLANFALISTFVGDIANTGTIMALATATNVVGFRFADNKSDRLSSAYAAGIQVDTFSGMTGNITNSSKGVIAAGAFASSQALSFATATGIYVDTPGSFVGSIKNDGTIIAQAVANAGSSIDSFAEANAAGISDIASTFIGNINNTGFISASASVGTGVPVTLFGSAFATGIHANSLTFLGDIANTGTISAYATSGAALESGIFAVGINNFASTFIGNVSNTAPGVIVAVAVNPFGFGDATGIRIENDTFLGAVNNTGTVMATGIGDVRATGLRIEGDTFIGNVNNTGAGLIFAKSSVFAVGVAVGGSTFVGNINNSALIMASGDATGIYSFPGTFIGAINNTGTIIGTGGTHDRGIRVVGASISGGINNSGTIQGGFASVDLTGETATPTTGTTINNQSHGLLQGDVLLSSNADTLNVFGGSTVKGNITGILASGTFGNNDLVNFDLNHDGFGGNVVNGFTVYQYKITDVNTVDLTSGTLILDDQEVVGTVTLGPGNIDPVGTFNQSPGSTLGLAVDVGHLKAPPAGATITVTSGVGSVSANTVIIGTGAVFKAFEEPDFYANLNIYPNVVVGLTSMFGNYDQTNVLSNSPLLAASMIENGSSSGGPGQDTLVLTRQKFNKPLGVGLTPNEAAAGGGLEGLYKTGNSTALAVIPPLFGLNGPQYALALKSLDGETILERPDLWQTVLDSILHRLTEGEAFNGAGVQGAMVNHGPIQVASAGESDGGLQLAQTNISPMGVVRPWSVWVRGYGVFGNGPATINATSFDETRYGALGGLDYRLSDNLLIGGIFNYSHGEVSLDAPTPAKNKQDAYQFAAYGKYQQGPWYVNAVAGGGFTDNSESRQVLIPAPATVNGSYNGETFSAYAETGWNLYPTSNTVLSPLVGLGYNWLRYDGFHESGSPAALNVNAATTDNLYTALGARAQAAFNIGTGAPLVPEIRVVWQHEFLDANQEMNASFGGGTLFNVQGSKFSRESVIAGIGVSNNVSPDLKVFLDYDAKLQGGYSAHAVSAGLKWAFGGAAPPPPPAAPPPVPAAQPAPPPPAQAQVFVVYFDFDKATLTPEAVGIIRQAADAYKRTGAVTIKVDGYTDLAGTQKYNIGLSKRRADAVRAELVKDGVPNNSVAEAWHGKENPAVPTPDGVREPRNRRATIALP